MSPRRSGGIAFATSVHMRAFRALFLIVATVSVTGCYSVEVESNGEWGNLYATVSESGDKTLRIEIVRKVTSQSPCGPHDSGEQCPRYDTSIRTITEPASVVITEGEADILPWPCEGLCMIVRPRTEDFRLSVHIKELDWDDTWMWSSIAPDAETPTR